MTYQNEHGKFMGTLSQAQAKEAVQMEPVNSTAAYREPIEHTLSRTEQRVANVMGRCEAFERLAEERGRQLEDNRARMEEAYAVLLTHNRAIEEGREALHIFTPEPGAFVRILIERHAQTVNHLAGILQWLDGLAMSPVAFGGENPVLYPRRYTNGDMERIMEAVGVMLELASRSIQDGIVPVRPADGMEGLPEWLSAMRASLKADVEPQPQGPVYYCPTCRRHVSPEDVKVAPKAGGFESYHAREHGGCGQTVEPRNRVKD